MNNDISAANSKKSPSAAFERYIRKGKKLAESVGLAWEIELDVEGVAIPGSAWDLRKLLNDGAPTTAKLRTFSKSPKAQIEMRERDLIPIDREIVLSPVSDSWQDLIKAFALNHLIVAGLSIQHLSSTREALIN